MCLYEKKRRYVASAISAIIMCVVIPVAFNAALHLGINGSLNSEISRPNATVRRQNLLIIRFSVPESLPPSSSAESSSVLEPVGASAQAARNVFEKEAPFSEFCDVSVQGRSSVSEPSAYRESTPVLESSAVPEQTVQNVFGAETPHSELYDGSCIQDIPSFDAEKVSGDVQSEAELFELLDRNISNNLIYPERARRRSIEGEVTVSLIIGPFGTLDSCRIISASGSTILDKAAQQLIERIFPLAESTYPYTAETSVRIVYSLRPIGNTSRM